MTLDLQAQILREESANKRRLCGRAQIETRDSRGVKLKLTGDVVLRLNEIVDDGVEAQDISVQIRSSSSCKAKR